MFRPMRRISQALTEEECFELLNKAPRGVLALHGEQGYPYALPLNFLFQDGKLYFHCAKQGHKLDAMAANEKVSFTVLDEGVRNAGDWALTFKSVILFGRIRRVEQSADSETILRRLGLKYYPTAEAVEEEIREAAMRVQILELSIDHLSGKRVTEK